MGQHLKLQKLSKTGNHKFEMSKGIVESAIAQKGRTKKEQGRFLHNRKKAK